MSSCLQVSFLFFFIVKTIEVAAYITEFEHPATNTGK
jgi:hypothetical protein